MEGGTDQGWEGDDESNVAGREEQSSEARGTYHRGSERSRSSWSVTKGVSGQGEESREKGRRSPLTSTCSTPKKGVNGTTTDSVPVPAVNEEKLSM